MDNTNNRNNHINDTGISDDNISWVPEPLMANNIIEEIQQLGTNIQLENRWKMDMFPFEKRMYNINRITMVNYAGTSFISGVDVASIYNTTDKYSRWFKENILEGYIEADLILTNPRSQAALDAARYKMKPKGQRIKSEDIILDNINKLIRWKREHHKARIHVRLTNMALPYGVMCMENDEDYTQNYMKVDLYSCLPGDDRNRPSFYIYQTDQRTNTLYQFLKTNMNSIWEKAEELTHFMSASWLKERTMKRIIHRGKIDKQTKEHSISGIFRCITTGLPMEVDLLQLKDGTIILGRNCKIRKRSGGEVFELSSLSIRVLRNIHTDDYVMINNRGEEELLPFLFEETLTFEEFLQLVNGKVPIIIEIKKPYSGSVVTDDIKQLVDKAVHCIRYYNGKFAFHSANPMVLACIKQFDETILCGQITWSFEGTDVPDEYKALHRGCEFIPDSENEKSNFIYPDFISCKVQELSNDEYRNRLYACKEKIWEKTGKKPPIFCWTVKTKQDLDDSKRWTDGSILEPWNENE